MPFQHRSDEAATDAVVPALESASVTSPLIPRPRRQILRALSGVAVGSVVLLGLASCGGEDEEGNGGGDGEEEDDD